jgi:hypothetical protein
MDKSTSCAISPDTNIPQEVPVAFAASLHVPHPQPLLTAATYVGIITLKI